MLTAIEGKELNQEILSLKRRGARVKSNVYAPLDPAGTYNAVITPGSVVYAEEDHGTNRLRFYTSSPQDITRILATFPMAATVDIISKNSDEFGTEMKAAGYILLAKMRRLVNRDITETMNTLTPPISIRGGVALNSDAPAINKLLWATFDTRISHLLSDDELAAAIEKGEVCTVKEQGKIVTVLQRSTDSNRFYINQVLNLAERECIHSLMYSELRKFYDSGGRYLYAWVQDTNIASNKFHTKYGMTFDGLYDLVYVNQ